MLTLTPPPRTSLAELIAVSCRVSRVDAEPRPEDPGESACEGKLLKCPTIGESMWLVIDDVRWVCTSPVVTIEAIEHDRSVHVIVRTGSSRYRLEFERWVIERANRRATLDGTPAPRLRGSAPQWRTIATWT